MKSEPEIRKNPSVSAIWILPIIALCICAWLIYSSYQNAGVEITINFSDATGIVPGKTQVMARGIPVGLVKKIHPDLNRHQVKVVVKMDKEVVQHLVKDTVFWIVRPELSASSVQGLDTILSGSYIGIQIGTSSTECRNFTGLSSAPPVAPDSPGLHFQLRAEVLGSIQVGTGIYYRNIEIGKVQNHHLVGAENILIDAFIQPQFTYLVREGSRFCNASGIQISGKLPNLKVKIESLASLLRGGILLHTPEQLQNTPKVKNGHIFPLFPDYESANFGIPMTLTIASGENIVEGSTKIMYRGLEAGFVKEIQINNDKRRTVTAHVLLDPRAELILRENTKFWIVKPAISPSGIKNLRLLLSGSYITFKPGSGKFKNHFNILPQPPPQTPLRPGTSFVLSSPQSVNLSPQSPVYFKDIQVGEVTDVGLDDFGKNVKTTIFIYAEFLHLLSTKSVFWLHSGIKVSADIDRGISMTTGPLSSLINGGISFITPDKLKRQKNFPPPPGFQFRLYTNYKEATDLVTDLQPAGKHIHIIATDANSLTVNAPILFKNIKIGKINNFLLTKDHRSILIDCLIMDQYLDIISNKTRFYNTSGLQLSGGLGGVQLQTGSLKTILAGGIGCLNIPGAAPLPPGKPYPLYANLEDALRGDEITLSVRFTTIDGLKNGSAVKYNGVEIGRLTSLAFGDRGRTITGTISVKKNVATLFRNDTKIWIEQASFGLSGVKNLNTLVFGAFLNILPGHGAPTRNLVATNSPPWTEIASRRGTGIVLESKHLGSLAVHSPVYYRQIKVGEVTGFKLSRTFQKVLVFVTIKPAYIAIIRENTRFWNVSGTKITGGLFSGLTLTTESLEAVIRGGIALATPNNENSGKPILPGHHFILHDKPKKQWLDWSPDIIIFKKQGKKKLKKQ